MSMRVNYCWTTTYFFIAVKAFRNIAMNRSDSLICRNFIIDKYNVWDVHRHSPHIIDESLLNILNGSGVLACFSLPILKWRHIFVTISFVKKIACGFAIKILERFRVAFIANGKSDSISRDQVSSSLLLYCSSLLLLPPKEWLHISYVFNNCFGLFFW